MTDRQTDGQTDRQTDRILIARPRLHCMQRGKNVGLGGTESIPILVWAKNMDDINKGTEY